MALVAGLAFLQKSPHVSFLASHPISKLCRQGGGHTFIAEGFQKRCRLASFQELASLDLALARRDGRSRASFSTAVAALFGDTSTNESAPSASETPAVSSISRSATTAASSIASTQEMRSPFGVLYGSAMIASFLAKPQTSLAEVLIVVVAIMTFAVGTLDLGPYWITFVVDFENFLSIFFIAEYVLRWYARDCRPSYLLKWEMLVDALAGLPLILELFGLVNGSEASWTLAFLRLLRILRLQRYLRDTKTFMQLTESIGVTFKVGGFELQLARAVISISTLLFISSGLMYTFEHKLNPQFPNYFVSVYFGLVTLTTVGFGDITPITSEGRAVVCVSILVGVALIPVQLSSLAEAFIDRFQSSTKEGAASKPSGFEPMAEALARQEAKMDAIVQRLGAADLTGDANRGLTRPFAVDVRCKGCHTCAHLLGANFCYLCGEPLLCSEGREA